MSPFLALGLLVAVFCPIVQVDSASTLGRKNWAQDNKTHVDNPSNTNFASSNTDFAFSLYKKLALRTPNKNLFFSPVSISTALAFVSLGARGTTLTEMLEGLKFNLTVTSEAEIHQGFQNLLSTLNEFSNELQLSIGNAMFVADYLKLIEKFKEDARQLYQAEAFNINFQEGNSAARFINDYVENKTHGKIKNLMSDLTEDTAMVVVNYIFLKAKWKNPFDPHDTHESEFHVNKTKSVMVSMMKISHLSVPYFRDEELSCTVVQLEYASHASALFILPDEGKMKEVETMLSPETLRKWRESLNTRIIDKLYLPKFSISSDYNLEQILPQLGMKKVFTSQADLSGITQETALKVSQVVHKAVVDVAENGTEAAAATGIKLMLTSAWVGPQTIIRFDMPFLMAIVSSSTQNILFMGKVVDPTEQ